jgi:hypothetical protein
LTRYIVDGAAPWRYLSIMPTKKPAKLRPDVNETAYRVMLEATGQAEKTQPPGQRSDDQKNPAAVERGRVGGKKGGKTRARRLTASERSDSARKAAEARWRETKAEE